MRGAVAQRRFLRVLAVGLLALPLLLMATGSTLAAWSQQTVNGGNVFQATTIAPPTNLALESSCTPSQVSLREGGTGWASSGGKVASPSITKPAAIQDGDLVVAQVVAKTTTTAPAGSGWVKLREDAVASSLSSAIFYKFAGAAEPSTYEWNTTSDKWVIGIAAAVGVDPVAPITDHGGMTATTGTQIDAPSVTTTQPNQAVIAMFSQQHGTSFSVAGALWDASSSGGGQAVNLRAMADYAVSAEAGSTGVRSVHGSSNVAKTGQRIALRAAPASFWATATWTASTSPDVQGHQLVRSLAGQDQASYNLTPATEVTQLDGPLEGSTTYDYRVRAFLGDWFSAPATASITMPSSC